MFEISAMKEDERPAFVLSNVEDFSVSRSKPVADAQIDRAESGEAVRRIPKTPVSTRKRHEPSCSSLMRNQPNRPQQSRR